MDKLMLATDGSKHSMKTVDQAIKLASKLGAEVTILYVIEGNPQIGYDLFAAYKKTEAELENKSKKVLDKSAQPFIDKGIPVKTRLEKGHPADIICEIAEKEKFDYVILGSRGLGGIKEMLLGSVSNAVANCIKTNIIIIK